MGVKRINLGNDKMTDEILIPETLRIILSIIGILLLISLLASLYLAHLRNKELELAKASLDYLIDEINAGKTEVNIHNPSPWGIDSFKKESGEIPYRCLNKGFENCICICNIETFMAPGGRKSYEQCDRDNAGVCLESNYDIEAPGIMIVPSLVLEIDHENKMIRAKNEY